MDTRSITAPLSAAASHLGAIARNIGSAGVRLRKSLRDEELRRQLVSAAESLRDAARETAATMHAAAMPYARDLAASAQEKFAALPENLSAGVEAAAKTVEVAAKKMRRPNVVTRHPYATVALVAGGVLVAVRTWRRRKSATSAKQAAKRAVRKPAPGKKSNVTALRANARRKRAANGQGAPAKESTAVH
jgi:hypothetical protein